jgi:hypothetical protein
VIKLEREGAPSLEQKVLIREGEKARPIDFKLGGSSTTGGGGGGGNKDVPPPQTGGHTIPPWIVVGVGAAAVATGVIIYFVERGNVPSQCDFGSRTCQRNGLTDAQVNDLEQKASDATSLANVGLIIAISGAVVAAGGLVWHFVEPTGPSQPATAALPTFKNIGLRNVTPVVGPHYTGAGFSAAF